MSLILDALKKSDAERNRQRAPEAAAVVQPAGPSGARRWWLPVIALLAVNALALTWLALRPAATGPRTAAPDGMPAQPAAAPAQSAALPGREATAAPVTGGDTRGAGTGRQGTSATALQPDFRCAVPLWRSRRADHASERQRIQ